SCRVPDQAREPDALFPSSGVRFQDRGLPEPCYRDLSTFAASIAVFTCCFSSGGGKTDRRPSDFSHSSRHHPLVWWRCSSSSSSRLSYACSSSVAPSPSNCLAHCPISSQLAWSFVSATTTQSHATSCAASGLPSARAIFIPITSALPLCWTIWQPGVISSGSRPIATHTPVRISTCRTVCSRYFSHSSRRSSLTAHSSAVL